MVFTLLLVLGAVLLHLVVYQRLWLSVYHHPALEGVDFILFYTAGHLAQSGSLAHLYDLEAQRAIQQTIIPNPDFVPGGVLPFNHPPFLVPLMALIVGEDYHASFLRWTVMLLLVLAFCGWMMARLLEETGWERVEGRAIALSGLCFYPLFISMLKGQVTVFLLAGVLLWLWGTLNRRAWMAGVGLALTILKPQIAVPLALPLLLTRRREGWWFVGTSLALMLASLLMIGWQGWRDFFGMILLTAQGEGFGINQRVMYNVTGLVLRLLPGLSPALVRGVGWGVFLLVTGWLCWFWWSRRHHITAPHLGLTIILALFSSPHLHFHDLSLLLVPLLVLVAVGAAQAERGRVVAILLLPLSSLLLLTGSLAGGIWLPLLVSLMMLVAGVALVLLPPPAAPPTVAES